MKKILAAALVFAALAPLSSVSAHEVYVLSEAEISHDLTLPPPDFIASIRAHLG